MTFNRIKRAIIVSSDITFHNHLTIELQLEIVVVVVVVVKKNFVKTHYEIKKNEIKI